MAGKTEELALELLVETIQDKLFEQPIIVFQSLDKPETKLAIERALEGSDVTLSVINDALNAAVQQGSSRRIARGVFLLDRGLARGYDLKFAKDAFVIVLSQDGRIPWSECNQMIGRSARLQDCHQGAYITVSSGDLSKSSYKEVIYAQQGCLFDDAGALILAAIIKIWESSSSQDKAQIV